MNELRQLRRTRIPGRNQNSGDKISPETASKCCEGREFLEGIKTHSGPGVIVRNDGLRRTRIPGRNQNTGRESATPVTNQLRRTRIPGRNQNRTSSRTASSEVSSCEGREFLEGIKTLRRRTIVARPSGVAKDENSWKESKRGCRFPGARRTFCCEGREFLEGIKT